MGVVKILIFLLISIIGFCQTSKFTLEDIETIKDVNSFKKVMMERGLEKVDDEGYNNLVIYGYKVNEDSEGELVTSLLGMYYYYLDGDEIQISFNDEDVFLENEYNELFDKVKLDCDFIDIDNSQSVEFIKYDCGNGFIIGFGKKMVGLSLLIKKYITE